MNSLKQILAAAQAMGPTRVAVAGAQDPEVLEAIKLADEAGLCRAVLFGDSRAIEAGAVQVGLDLSRHQVMDAPDLKTAARLAVSLVSAKKAQVVMKGMIGTADFLRAVLDKENGLRTGRTLSHVVAFELPGVNRLMMMTDGAMNVAPDLKTKVDIVKNALQFARGIGVERPRIAALAAVETVNPDMPATTDAALLAKMAERGQLGDCLLDGPLALDIAVNPEALHHKGVTSCLEGQADILLVPDIEAGNILYKALVYFGQARPAGLVMGAAAPIVLLSRADSAESKTLSIALSRLMAG